MEEENIYEKIQELFGRFPENLNILEESINIDLQMEYFEFSKKLKKEQAEPGLLDQSVNLFDMEFPSESKKKLLATLASLEEVEAYRMIEKYLTEPDPELRDWAILSLQESRMLLQSKLLDQNQVFISTGLGGRGTDLRYFVVVLLKEDTLFSDLQKKILRNEFEFILKRHKAEIEQISFEERFAILLTLLPIKAPIQELFREAITETNQYGSFLETNFIVTNVKKMELAEIKDFIKKQKSMKPSSDPEDLPGSLP